MLRFYHEISLEAEKNTPILSIRANLSHKTNWTEKHWSTAVQTSLRLLRLGKCLQTTSVLFRKGELVRLFNNFLWTCGSRSSLSLAQGFAYKKAIVAYWVLSLMAIGNPDVYYTIYDKFAFFSKRRTFGALLKINSFGFNLDMKTRCNLVENIVVLPSFRNKNVNQIAIKRFAYYVLWQVSPFEQL